MDPVKTLEDLIAKTTNHTSNGNRKKAVEALQALFAENSDFKQIAGYLTKFHYSVCQSFFEKFSSSATDDNIVALAQALINNEQFKKNNLTNQVMYPKGLIAVQILANKGKNQASFLILNEILFRSEEAKGFTDGCFNNFKKLIVDKNGMDYIFSMYEQVKAGEITCKEFEKKRFDRFIEALDKKLGITSQSKSDATALLSHQENTFSNVSNTSGNNNPIFPNKNQKNKDEILTRIERMQQDILSIIREYSTSQSSIDSLTTAISHRDEELSEIKENLKNKIHENSMLKSEIATKERQLKESDKKIADLTEKLKNKIDENSILQSEITAKERQQIESNKKIADLTEDLQTSLKMDSISKNNALITLKNDISEALKLDYSDFISSKEDPYSEDLFEVYRSILTRVFKLLKRLGITCQ